jgi:hypothetical protein
MAEMTKDRRLDLDAHHRLEGRVEPDRPDRGGHTLSVGTDELVRILAELTCDFERFDSMIHDQRTMLEQRADGVRLAGDIDRESHRFRLEVSEMAERTQKALEQLNNLTEPVKTRRY